MEFAQKNLINTTTQMTVDSNTASVANIFDPDPVFQYVSDGFNDDLTTTSITVSFGATFTVSRIALKEINWKAWTAYYNGSTANTFTLTATSGTIHTSASDFSSNSETSMYLVANAVAVTSVTFDLKTTQVANNEKAVGLIHLSDVELEFGNNTPSAKNYKPDIDPKEIVHQMSDGGVRLHTIQDKFSVQVKLTNVDETFRNNLKAVFEQHSEFFFVPFGTATGWDGIGFECVWPGRFNFFRYSDDAAGSGFSGTINVKETAR